MTALNTLDFAAAPMGRLVEFYNARASLLGEKPVARFADKTSATRRCDAIATRALAAIQAADLAAREAAASAEGGAYKFGRCPACGGTEDITCGTVIESRTGQRIAREHEATCHRCGHEFNANTGKPLKARAPVSKGAAARISASWADPEIRAARLTRVGVRAVLQDGRSHDFKSMAEALDSLPYGRGSLCRIRLEMKAAGQVEFKGIKFIAIPTV